MVCKLAWQTYTSEFESHWVPLSYGLVPHLNKKLSKLPLEPNPRTGRPHMSTKPEDRNIIEMSLKDRFDAATSISRTFCEQTERTSSRKTVSLRLSKEKLMARIPWCKPLISKKNQKVRLDFATEHIVGQGTMQCFSL